jgi:transcription elongation GreA/GreB family factor
VNIERKEAENKVEIGKRVLLAFDVKEEDTEWVKIISAEEKLHNPNNRYDDLIMISEDEILAKVLLGQVVGNEIVYRVSNQDNQAKILEIK